MQPWPAESTKRSRLTHWGSSGLKVMDWPKRTAPISAAPSGRPRWPDLAAAIESIARPRASLAAVWRASDVAGATYGVDGELFGS